MFDQLGALLRRARFRNQQEGQVQHARAEIHAGEVRDDVERWQDYGFSARPVEGQGLLFEVGGYSFAVRLDRLDERPELDRYEVCVWHKEGHRVTLRDGKVVHVECDELLIDAALKVQINTPQLMVQASTSVTFMTPNFTTPTAYVLNSLMLAGKEIAGHRHPTGSPFTGPNS